MCESAAHRNTTDVTEREEQESDGGKAGSWESEDSCLDGPWVTPA